MTPARARRARPVGLQAEVIAEKYLQERGYELLARNHHSRDGEVDLIVGRGELVVFVEVKARKARAMVDPLTSVTPAKQRKIVRAALDYVRRAGVEGRAMRFDVIALTLSAKVAAPSIQHLEGAFDASAGDDPAGGRW